MNLLAPVNRDAFGRPFDPSALTQSDAGGQPGSFPLDPAGLLGVFARIHALGLAHLASRRGSAGQADGSTTDQPSSAPKVPQALPAGLLALLAAAPASGVSPQPADAASGTTDTTIPNPADASPIEGRAQQRYVSGIADQVNGGSSNGKPPLLARGTTNCENAWGYCMARLPDLRSRRRCDDLRTLCERGIDGIFGPGVAGSSRVD